MSESTVVLLSAAGAATIPSMLDIGRSPEVGPRAVLAGRCAVQVWSAETAGADLAARANRAKVHLLEALAEVPPLIFRRPLEPVNLPIDFLTLGVSQRHVTNEHAAIP